MDFFPDNTTLNIALCIARVGLGLMIMAHGYAKVFRGGRIAGTAGWFESIGMRPGKLNAIMAAGTELGTGALLVAGFLTPLAAAGLVALMTVAIVTVHRKNGFFVYNPGQGIEYCGIIALYALFVGTFGPGTYSLDKALDLNIFFNDTPSHAFWTVVVVGVGGAVVQLLAVYRPPRQD
ncbi:MAG: DoxX family protein [Acidobacteria bacterium]|nr:DoxX family protein [Acidobacteriota bacterium]